MVIHPDAEILRKPHRRVLRVHPEHFLIQAHRVAALVAAEAVPCAITVDAQRSGFLTVQRAARPVLGTGFFQLQPQPFRRFQRRNLPDLLKNAQSASLLPVQLAPHSNPCGASAFVKPM